MANTAKSALKPYVAGWLNELEACYKTREVFSPALGRRVEQRFLAHPPMAEHTGRLHHLIQADYSPLVPASKIDAYLAHLEATGERVFLARKTFPANYYWTIIKKWDRWKRLRVIPRIRQYVGDVQKFWEDHWALHGGPTSPYTREWIQYENLLDAHRFVYGEAANEDHATWDRQFPVVAVMRRIERGEAPRAADVNILEKWASPWCKRHVAPCAESLDKRLRLLDVNRAELREEGIDCIREGVSALYAAALAQDIQERHQRALTVVRRWNSGWGLHVSGYFAALANVDYIRHLRKVMPLLRVGDPGWEQKLRDKKAKAASSKRMRVDRAVDTSG